MAAIKSCPSCHAISGRKARFCPACGAELPEEATCEVCGEVVAAPDLFCRRCGTPADAAAPSAGSDLTTPGPLPPPTGYVNPTPTPPERRSIAHRRMNRGVLLWVATPVLLLAFLAGAYLMAHRDRPDLAGRVPAADLYISNGIELGALYQPSGYPAQIPLNNHDGITGLTWSVGSLSATGTGTLQEDDCVPDCARGTNVTYPVQVTASDPQQCTVRIYQRPAGTFQQVPAHVFTTVTVRALSGSPPVLARPGPLFGPVCR